MRQHGASRSFCVNDFAERCNEKETKNEETKIVKWVVGIVRRGGVTLIFWLAAVEAKEWVRLFPT